MQRVQMLAQIADDSRLFVTEVRSDGSSRTTEVCRDGSGLTAELPPDAELAAAGRQDAQEARHDATRRPPLACIN
jgi:hypothetical protein